MCIVNLLPIHQEKKRPRRKDPISYSLNIPFIENLLRQMRSNLREATQKKSSLNGWAIKRGGGGQVKGGPLRKKELFLLFFSNVPKFQRPLSSRPGLHGPAIKKRTFQFLLRLLLNLNRNVLLLLLSYFTLLLWHSCICILYILVHVYVIKNEEHMYLNELCSRC